MIHTTHPDPILLRTSCRVFFLLPLCERVPSASHVPPPSRRVLRTRARSSRAAAWMRCASDPINAPPPPVLLPPFSTLWVRGRGTSKGGGHAGPNRPPGGMTECNWRFDSMKDGQAGHHFRETISQGRGGTGKQAVGGGEGEGKGGGNGLNTHRTTGDTDSHAASESRLTSRLSQFLFQFLPSTQWFAHSQL